MERPKKPLRPLRLFIGSLSIEISNKERWFTPSLLFSPFFALLKKI